jgi:hypothetical protein
MFIGFEENSVYQLARTLNKWKTEHPDEVIVDLKYGVYESLSGRTYYSALVQHQKKEEQK